MNDKQLRTIFESVLMEYNFQKRRYIYVRDFGSFLLRVSLQRFNESEEYYFYCYFLVKEFHEESRLLSFVTADITGRQPFNVNGKEIESLKIENYDIDSAKKIITSTIDELVKLIESGGIKGYLTKYPEAMNSVPTVTIEFFERLASKKDSENKDTKNI